MTPTSPTPADLLDLVGAPLGVSTWHEITQERVNLFADATDDHQWIHTDPVRAAAGPFGTHRPRIPDAGVGAPADRRGVGVDEVPLR